MWLQHCHLRVQVNSAPCSVRPTADRFNNRDPQHTRSTVSALPATRSNAHVQNITTGDGCYETPQLSTHVTTRLASAVAAAALLLSASTPAWAEKLTLEDVTPPLVQQGELLKRYAQTAGCPPV